MRSGLTRVHCIRASRILESESEVDVMDYQGTGGQIEGLSPSHG